MQLCVSEGLLAGGTGELRGQVTAGGRPLAGMRLMVTSFHGRRRGFDTHFPVTDADGRYAVAGLPQANYLVTLPSTVQGGSAHVNAGRQVELDIDLGQRKRSEPRQDDEPESPPAEASVRQESSAQVR